MAHLNLVENVQKMRYTFDSDGAPKETVQSIRSISRATGLSHTMVNNISDLFYLENTKLPDPEILNKVRATREAKYAAVSILAQTDRLKRDAGLTLEERAKKLNKEFPGVILSR